MYALIKSLSHRGLETFSVDVEADFSKGMPSFDIVGLGDAAIRESKDRIRSAFRNCGYTFPVARIVINLAPASMPKTGSMFDLPIFMALMAASEQIPMISEKSLFIGELSMSGRLNPVRGVLSKVIFAREHGFDSIFIPYKNAVQASAIGGINVYPAVTVSEIIDHLSDGPKIKPLAKCEFDDIAEETFSLDFCDVKGQESAKRAIEISAAGGHNLMMIGPPGSGKSMLAKRIPSILPQLTFEESLEVTGIYSICDSFSPDIKMRKIRPFRSPHHNASPASLIGGGANPNPGEISLSHHGVLFLDEIAEFPSHILESLRQPIEDKCVSLSRVSYRVTFPCNFQLIAAMNPCKCGFFGDSTHKCTCSESSVERYLSKISGPILDRFDLHVEVSAVKFSDLSGNSVSEDSESIRERVLAARNIQTERFAGTGISCNSDMPPNMIKEFCEMDDGAMKVLEKSFKAYSFSARTYDKVRKVARTIADLDNSEIILQNHLTEAIQYRLLERKYWKK
ncbi:MAG: YifB family Mg chelatase-like AAA ATPase [Oscillospiraceae bacterium]|jgi:magnesium chelatase family protein|nr:YifB family Mg chelatase-like AAA ATPase [Oscillospiraceae bacterium]